MDDDDGFVGYVESTVDPGPWLILATAIVCVISIVIVPCLVSAGRRYDEKKARQHQHTPDEPTTEDHVEQSINDENELMPPPSVVEDTGRKLHAIFDKFVSPSYPDDDDDSTHHVGSLPWSWRPGGPHVPDDDSLVSFATILDAGAAVRHGHVHFPRHKREMRRELKREKQEQLMLRRLERRGIDGPSTMYKSLLKESLERNITKQSPDGDVDGSKQDEAHSDYSATNTDAQDLSLPGIAQYIKQLLLPADNNNDNSAKNGPKNDTSIEQLRPVTPQSEEPKQCTSSNEVSTLSVRESESLSSSGYIEAGDQSGKVSKQVDGTPQTVPPENSPSNSSSSAKHASKKPQVFFPDEGDLEGSPHDTKIVSIHPTDDEDEPGSLLDGESDIFPDDAVDGKESTGMCGKETPMEGVYTDLPDGERAWWRPSSIVAGFDRLLEVAEWNKEMKRILSLAIPFSLAASSSGACETVRVALVANFIGTDAVGAYTIVLIVLGLTQEFCLGFALTCASLCAHAVGAENRLKAGQLVQVSSILYTLCMIPNIIAWMFLMDDVARLFGYDYATSLMAQDYARYYVIKQWGQGLEESYGSLLCVTEHEWFYTAMKIASEAVATFTILGLVLLRPTNLGLVGLVELLSQALCVGLTLVISTQMGWMKDYTKGMYRTFALWNTSVVKAVFKTAVPLSFGQLLQNGEWEILTIFVAFLGPAEVTTWGIIGSLWDTIEKLTEGFGDAGEIRTGLHLGAARPATAKLSSYKTIFVGIIFALVITSIMWIIGEDLAVWLTPDPTLQRLIVEVLPLIGLGNIALTAGFVSWALIGAQGRYRLATLAAFVSSWCVTLPVAAIFVFVFRFDLQGIVSAVVVGYSVTGTILQYILARSDWESLSKLIIELNGGVESDSDSDSSSSRSDCKSDSSSSSSDKKYDSSSPTSDNKYNSSPSPRSMWV